MTSPSSPPPARPTIDPKRAILHTAWLAVLLGVGIEALLLAIAAGSGPLASLKPFVADLMQKVSWSVVVCVGLAFGKSVSRSAVGASGLAGLLAAPVGFNTAKALHKGTSTALGIAGGAAVGAPPAFLIAGIKALQYLALGAGVAYLVQRGKDSFLRYVAVGLAVGVVFGGMILALMIRAAAPTTFSTATLLSRVVNEMLFPVGCAAALFVAEVMAKKPEPAPAQG